MSQSHNLRKLSILIACFNYFRTSGQVSKDTLPLGESLAEHKEKVKKTLSRLRYYFKHPYLKSERLKHRRAGGIIAYKCTPKGRRVCCELFFRKKNGFALNWNGQYHVICEKTCSECGYNPTLNPDHKNIMEKPDTRPIYLISCECGYKRTFRAPIGTDLSFIEARKGDLMMKHYAKEHSSYFKPSHNDCKNNRRTQRGVTNE